MVKVTRWYNVLWGTHTYNEGPEEETAWVRDAFCVGVMLGVAIMSIGFYIFL